jgi:hypothetical protein
MADMVPAGYRSVVDPVAARALFAELPGTARLRSDSYATRWAVWRALTDHVDDEGMVIAGQARIAERASYHAGRYIGRSTAGNHLRALVAEGAISVLPGASKEALGSERDRASVYVFLTPVVEDQVDADVELTDEQLAEVDRVSAQLESRLVPVHEHGHLPEGSAHTRTQEITHPHKHSGFPCSTTDSGHPANRHNPSQRPSVLGREHVETPGPARRERPGRFAARTGPERALAAQWIAATMGWNIQRRRFAAVTEKELRVVCARFFAAGWCPAAVVQGFLVQPDGTPWPGPLPNPDQRDHPDKPRIRCLAAVLTTRLTAWLDPMGHPISPPVPTELPPRGRPRKTAPAASATPTAVRSDQAAAALALFRAGNNQQLAARAAEQAPRSARYDAAWWPEPASRDATDDRSGLRAVYLRAQIDRR